MRSAGATSYGDDYSQRPKGNLDVTGTYFIWTSNMGGDRLDAFLVKIPDEPAGMPRRPLPAADAARQMTTRRMAGRPDDHMTRCIVYPSMPVPVDIAPARGKLGILLVGLGAVSTTTIAGVSPFAKGFAKPIGSLTQMGTVRLGKRTEGRSPKISDVVPLASLDDLVFGGWDIFDDDCYAAARTAGVIEPSLLDKVRPDLEDPSLARGVRSAVRQAA